MICIPFTLMNIHKELVKKEIDVEGDKLFYTKDPV